MNSLSRFHDRHRGKLWFAQVAVLLGVGVMVGMSLGGHSMPDGSAVADPHAGHQVSAAAEPQVWTCSMHPQIRRDGPGKCPICAMDLVAVKRSAGGVRTISISPSIKKLMNVQTVPVQRRYVTANVRMVGKIEYDETKLAHITAWVSGRLDRLYVDYTGVEVKKGDHMVYIYSEELYTAQEELIAALESKVDNSSSRFIQPLNLVESSREKLRLLGLTPEQIQEIEQRRKPTDHVTIYSPVGGIVIEKLLQEGDRVRTGDRIYTVADLRQLWLMMDAYESDLAWLRYGQDVEFTTEAYPGEVFHGRVAFINPVLNEATRTVKVRVNVSNDDGRLKPEMFVRAVVRSNIAAGGRVLDASLAGKWISPMHPEIIKDEPGNCDVCGMPLVRAETLGYVTAQPNDAAKPLVIPVSAALLTGTRAIVYVQIPNAEEPTYEGREIVLGPRAGDYYLVRSGVEEGELVVTHGNFKLDSALQISAKPSMMTPDGGGGGGGHHHGGSDSKSDSEQTSGMKMAASMGLPPQVQSQLHSLFQAFDSIRKAIEAADLVQIRAAFGEFGSVLSAVDAKSATGDAAAQWRDLEMLLTNDVVEGSEIHTLQAADAIYLVTKGHVERLRKQFGLAHEDHQMPIEIVAPKEFQQQLGQLVPAYLFIADALADDDWNRAAPAVTGLKKQIAGISAASLSGETQEQWEKEHTSLTKIAAELAAAADIEAARSAFALLSEELLGLHKTFGLADVRLFEHHCPMAFDGRGASWVQDNEATKNPYYGATMLKCADRVERLE